MHNELNKFMLMIEADTEMVPTVAGTKREVDYAPPQNDPIEGDDKLFNDLPEELQPDYVPQGYMKGKVGEGSDCCKEFTSNFADI